MPFTISFSLKGSSRIISDMEYDFLENLYLRLAIRSHTCDYQGSRRIKTLRIFVLVMTNKGEIKT